MKNTFCLSFLVFMILCFPLLSSAQSDVKPIQISIWDTVQLFDTETSIHGIRLTLLYGVNRDIHGVDWGMVHNKVNGDMIGWQSGFVNIVEGETKGLQEGFVNIVKGNFGGWQSGCCEYK